MPTLLDQTYGAPPPPAPTPSMVLGRRRRAALRRGFVLLSGGGPRQIAIREGFNDRDQTHWQAWDRWHAPPRATATGAPAIPPAPRWSLPDPQGATAGSPSSMTTTGPSTPAPTVMTGSTASRGRTDAVDPSLHHHPARRLASMAHRRRLLRLAGGPGPQRRRGRKRCGAITDSAPSSGYGRSARPVTSPSTTNCDMEDANLVGSGFIGLI